ncbi:odorant receptor 131-2-like [Alosa alosa]|uniref:odorant receptor 131-2-like n=1 Tax=Alosa alosa TaxID=278164 RepID=UPI002015397B|nr:odorant receptor 131-2-like [Alosa alosa]
MQNYMSSNTTAIGYLSRPLNEKILLVQVLVGIFLYVNFLMIFTFLKKEAFRTDTRYVLFAQTLFMDSFLMLLTDLALTGNYFQFPIPWIPCCALCFLMSWLSIGTPLTLVAMCLERYVAICMPLRHADISSPRNQRRGLVVIWVVSTLIPMFTLVSFLSLVPPAFLLTYVVCSVEQMQVQTWVNEVRKALLLMYFVLMFSVIVFTYIAILKAARTASSDNKKSTHKGLRTVILHTFQLLLCLTQFVCPFVEMAMLKIDFMLFINVRYSNFIVFFIAPRCLSPLIYGLRDEKFYVVLRRYASFGLDAVVFTLPTAEKKKLRCQARTTPL